MWQGFIIGIFFMSMFATIGFILIDKGYNHAVLFCGPVMWIGVIFVCCYNAVTHWVTYHDVRSLLVCPDGSIRYIKPKLVEIMRECKDRDYDFPKFSEHLEWDVNDWDKDFVWGNLGNIRYAPKKVWKQYGPISREEIKYAKNNPWEDDGE